MATTAMVSVVRAPGASATPASLQTVVSAPGLSYPAELAFDSGGNLYISNFAGGSISVLPKASGDLFGIPVTANALATLISGLNGPVGLAFDTSGDLFIAGAGANTVSVLPRTSGSLFGVSVTANTLATLVSSGLNSPQDLTFDSSGNLYISNAGTETVSVLPKISGSLFGVPVTADALTTLVSSGLSDPIGLAFDASGNLYVSDFTAAGTVSVLPKASGMVFGTPVTANDLTTLTSGLTDPYDLAFDTSGNLYISNFGGTGTVSVLPTTSGTLFGVPVTANTLASLVSSGLKGPQGLAFDALSNLYIANNDAGTVSVLPTTSGTLFGVAVAANALTTLISGLSTPYGLTVDASGNLYIANYAAGTVSVLPKASGSLFGVPVNANALVTLVSGLNGPAGLAFDSSGNLYIANVGSSTVSVLPKASGSLFGVAVNANTLTTLVSSGLNEPTGLAFDSAGDLYIANYAAGTVSVLPRASGSLFGVAVNANTLTTLVSSGLSGPAGLAFDSAGDLYITNNATDTVSVLPQASGSLFGVGVTADALTILVSSGLSGPAGLAFDSAGDLYITNEAAGTVSVLPRASGSLFGVLVNANTLTTLVSSGLNGPVGLAFDSLGNLYISQASVDSVSELVNSQPLSIATTSPLPGATVGSSYIDSLSATGGTKPYAWILTSGNLPPGLMLSPTGTISGVPTTSGTYECEIELSDSSVATQTATTDLSIAVSGTVPGPPTSVAAIPGNESTVVTWAPPTFNGGSQITGYDVYANGTKVISTDSTATSVDVPNLTNGTSYSIAVAADNAVGSSTQSSPTATVTPAVPLLTIVTPSAPPGMVGDPYSTALTATGGTSPENWTKTGGVLPPGLSLSATGVISGVPTSSGSYAFTVEATDSTFPNPESASASLAISVAATGPPAISSMYPTSGPTDGGEYVIIAGSGFSTASGGTSFDFGSGNPANDVVCPLTVLCVAVVPSDSIGAVDVLASVGTSQSATQSADVFTYSSLTVSGLAPAVGLPSGETTVSISGTGFSTVPGATEVSFGGSAATQVVCLSTTACTAVSPSASAETVGVTVDVNGVTSTTSPDTQFTYQEPPPSGLHVVFNPSPFVPPTSLTAGEVVPFTATAEDATGNPTPDTTVYLEAGYPVSEGTFTVGSTLLTSTPQAFTTDSQGDVEILYTAPNPLPSQGTPSIDAAVTPFDSPQGLDFYQFSAPEEIPPPGCTGTCTIPDQQTVSCTSNPWTDPNSCGSSGSNSPYVQYAIQVLQTIAVQAAGELPCVGLVIDAPSALSDLQSLYQSISSNPGDSITILNLLTAYDLVDSVQGAIESGAECVAIIAPFAPEILLTAAAIGAGILLGIVVANYLPIPVITVTPKVCSVPPAAVNASLNFSQTPLAPAGTLNNTPGKVVPFTLTVQGQDGPVPDTTVFLNGTNAEDGAFQAGATVLPVGWTPVVSGSDGKIDLTYTVPSVIPTDGSFPIINATLCPPGLPTFEVSGFKTFTQMEADEFPSLTPVATETTDASGDAEFSVNLPPSTGNGPLTIQISGTAPNGEPVFTTVDVPDTASTFGADGTAMTSEPTPSISQVLPDLGSTAGGETVDIRGSNLEDTVGVDFGDPGATGFTVESPSLITAIVPPGTGMVDVTVAALGGNSATSSASEFAYQAPISTSVTLASSMNPSLMGATITYTATVTPSSDGTPTGAVSFDDTGIPIDCMSGSQAFNGSTATCQVNYASGGHHEVTAEYVGDSIFSGSTSTTLAQTVDGISSPSSCTGTLGSNFLCTITTVGPAPISITEKGKLPKGVRFHNVRNGTATISGTPKSTKKRSAAGTYNLVITATLGRGKGKQTVMQPFILSIKP